MRAAIMRVLSTAFTSRALRDFRRRRARRSGRPVVDYFHQADDPYSALAVQVLARLAERYDVHIRPWLVPPPEASAAPELGRLRALALRDAARVAREYGLSFPEDAALPRPDLVAQASDRLAAVLDAPDFAARAEAIGQALWRGEALPGETADSAAALAAGDAERRRLGHYLSAMLHFEGEWYWGVDRLNHLEERLAGLGRDRQPGTPMIAPYRDMRLDGGPCAGQAPVIEVWFSFRSPYSWIAFPRVRRLARTYGAELRLRYILPMVMRGLPVPPTKRLYIMLDTKREAERVGLPYGTMVDPVGAGAERCLAVVHHAVKLDREIAETFAELAMRGAFAEGIDLASDKGLGDVARRAGLTPAQVSAALADDSWRIAAEANRVALFEAGLWGAPTYRVNGGPAHWGQDRLWALEQDLVAAQASGQPIQR